MMIFSKTIFMRLSKMDLQDRAHTQPVMQVKYCKVGYCNCVTLSYDAVSQTGTGLLEPCGN